MQKIILDSNVLVTALITRGGFSSKIIDDLVATRKVSVCVSDEIFAEYMDVLFRPKFSRYPDFYSRADLLLNTLRKFGENYRPTERVTIISDEPDNRFAELALEANADFLITGNSRDFTMDRIGQTRIINPKDYYEQFRD